MNLVFVYSENVHGLAYSLCLYPKYKNVENDLFGHIYEQAYASEQIKQS